MLFEPKIVLFEKDGFKIAWGYWKEDEGMRLGVRWINYPFERSGDEAWLVIHENITDDFVKSLIFKEGSRLDGIIEVLKKLDNDGQK